MNVYKIEVMVIDIDKIGREAIQKAIEHPLHPCLRIKPRVKKIESRVIGEWHDQHPLNPAEQTDAEYQRLFAAPKDAPPAMKESVPSPTTDTSRTWLAGMALNGLLHSAAYGGELKRIFDRDATIADAGKDLEPPQHYTARIALSLADATLSALREPCENIPSSQTKPDASVPNVSVNSVRPPDQRDHLIHPSHMMSPWKQEIIRTANIPRTGGRRSCLNCGAQQTSTMKGIRTDPQLREACLRPVVKAL